jgi:hypothetical protein
MTGAEGKRNSITLDWDYPKFDGGDSVTDYRIWWNRGKGSRMKFVLLNCTTSNTLTVSDWKSLDQP